MDVRSFVLYCLLIYKYLHCKKHINEDIVNLKILKWKTIQRGYLLNEELL